jgi:hypothetical protein
LVAAVVLVAAEFSTVSYRTIGIGACADRVGVDKCRTVGHDAHAFALIILAAVGLFMAWGAVVGRSRAAAWATAAVGVAVLVITLALDATSLSDKRGLEKLYNDVGTHVGTGFRLELIGGVLLLLVGGLAVQRLRGEEEEAALATMPPPEGDPVKGSEPEAETGAEAEAGGAEESETAAPEPEVYRPTTARAREREGRAKRSRERQRRRRKPDE